MPLALMSTSGTEAASQLQSGLITTSKALPLTDTNHNNMPFSSQLFTDHWETADFTQETCQTTVSWAPGAMPPPLKSTPETTVLSAKPVWPPETSQCRHIYDAVHSTGLPNYLSARIPLPHGLNMPVWRSYLQCYDQDPLLCDFLEFGWPINYTSDTPPTPVTANHGSALAFPRDVQAYLDRERSLSALLGPFSQQPFSPCFQTSALMTRPKKNSTERRIILDLSWPLLHSVNAGIPRDTYCGVPYKLRLPTADDAIALIHKHGPRCFMYSVDLARAYRQLRSDPLDWPLLGISWEDSYYVDISIPFGIRWGAMATQRMSQGICYIMNMENHDIMPYIDDFFGVEPTYDAAQIAFSSIQGLLSELGAEESTAKAIPPATCITWIGIEFDSQAMEVRMPQQKIDDTLSLLRQWQDTTRATLQQLRRLLGKLFHIGQTCKPARLFVSRMLDTLRSAPPSGYIELPDSFQRDVAWFLAFLPNYNGIHLLDLSPPLFIVEVDSCLSGCGGISEGEFYHTRFPDFILQQDLAICHLEMLNVVIAVKLWHLYWRHSRVRIHCDNAAAVAVINTGRGRDPFLLTCAREIWLLSALHDFQVEMLHIPGSQLSSADALSRCHLHDNFSRKVEIFTAGLRRAEVNPYLFHLCANI